MLATIAATPYRSTACIQTRLVGARSESFSVRGCCGIAQPRAEERRLWCAEHQQVWFEYYLDQAVDLYGVAAIFASTNAQYLAELEMDYVGFAEETTQTMLAHLRTQPVVLNDYYHESLTTLLTHLCVPTA